MNDDPNQAAKPEEPRSLQHQKTIAPLNSDTQPEITPPAEQPKPATAAMYPQPVSGVLASGGPVTSPSPQQALPQKTANTTLHRMRKVIALLFSGVLGFVFGGGYSQYWDGEDFLSRSHIASENYSPVVIGTPVFELAPFIVIVVAYGLILRFLFRSKYAFAQALFATFATELAVIGLLGIEHFNDKAVNIFGGAVDKFTVMAAGVAILFYVLANYMAERVWTWKVSRAVLAVTVLVLLGALTFAQSIIIKNHYNTRKQIEQKQSVQAKKESDAGLYNFDGGYQQYYPNAATQDRFRVVEIYATSITPTDEFKGYPHFTALELRDKNYTGTNDLLTIELWESKTPSTYTPPTNCGDPNPTQDYFGQKIGTDLYRAPCYKIQDIAGVGTLYARNDSKHEDPTAEEKASNTYSNYYLLQGETLITLSTLKTITGNDAAAIYKGLAPISSADFLAKSKTLATTPR